MKHYKILFCDLDGTLIDTLSGKIFPDGIWDMKFKIDVLDAIRRLAPEHVLIATNQGGIEKGFVNDYDFRTKITYVEMSIAEYCSVHVDYQYCTSNDKECATRKPNTGMLGLLYAFVNDGKISKSDCLMIGDASGLPGQFSDTDKRTAEDFGIDYMDVNEFVKVYNKE